MSCEEIVHNLDQDEKMYIDMILSLVGMVFINSMFIITERIEIYICLLILKIKKN